IATGDGAVWATMIRGNHGNVLVRFDPRTLRRTKTILPPSLSSSAGSVAVGEGAGWWAGGASGTGWRGGPSAGKSNNAIRISPVAGTVNDFTPNLIAAGADAVWVTVTYSP